MALPGEFTLDGVSYSGSYYSTYDGKYFTGPNPVLGTNKELIPFLLKNSNVEPAHSTKDRVIEKRRTQPISYYPVVTESDYSRGYLTRYFVKKANERGYVMEISEREYQSIKNGTATYDVSFYQLTSVLWKLTGPLNNRRVSQYDTRAGIVDTNRRQVEIASKTFLGIKEFIGEDYAKFARPTE